MPFMRTRNRFRRKSTRSWHTKDPVTGRTKPKKQTEEERRLAEQRAAADALQAQIDQLVSGKAPGQKPKSLRDFIDQKMVDDARKNKPSEKG